jgi:hypothetical protein
MIHVGPYTKDPHLFSTACDAGSIREAFEYTDYAGGKRVIWKARKPAELVKTKGQSPGLSLAMNITSPDNRRFWRGPIRSTLTVAKWPDWMRSGERISEERLQKCRAELLLMDEMDYWVRQPCTGPMYHEAWNSEHSNLLEPTCNWGMGCTACWAVYEKAYDKLAENWIDCQCNAVTLDFGTGLTCTGSCFRMVADVINHTCQWYPDPSADEPCGTPATKMITLRTKGYSTRSDFPPGISTASTIWLCDQHYDDPAIRENWEDLDLDYEY